MAGGEGFEDGKGKPLRYIYPFYFRPPSSGTPRSAFRSPSHISEHHAPVAQPRRRRHRRRPSPLHRRPHRRRLARVWPHPPLPHPASPPAPAQAARPRGIRLCSRLLQILAIHPGASPASPAVRPRRRQADPDPRARPPAAEQRQDVGVSGRLRVSQMSVSLPPDPVCTR
jgi:hypothetical protein